MFVHKIIYALIDHVEVENCLLRLVSLLHVHNGSSKANSDFYVAKFGELDTIE